MLLPRLPSIPRLPNPFHLPIQVLGPYQRGMLPCTHPILHSTNLRAFRKYKVKNIQISHLLEGLCVDEVNRGSGHGWEEGGQGKEESPNTGIYRNYLQKSSKKKKGHFIGAGAREESQKTAGPMKFWLLKSDTVVEFSRKNKTPFNNWPAGMSYRGIN